MTPWVIGAVVATGLTAGVLPLGAVTASGAVAGWTLTAVLTAQGGLAVLVPWILLVLLGTGASRLGRARKEAMGVAQEGGGRRRAAHALANGGPAALFLLVGGAACSPGAAAALGAALSDTLSSELGSLSPRRPRLLLFGPVRPHGTDGAMSWTGILAGAAGAALVGACSAALLGGGPPLAAAIGAGSLAGNVADSALGASIESRLGRAGNEVVNFAASLTGGLVGLLLAV